MDSQTFLMTALGLAERLGNDPDALHRAMQELLELSEGEQDNSGPPKVGPSPFEKGIFYKGGFTGTSKDRMGRNQCFVQGIHVPCADHSPIEARQGGGSRNTSTHSSSSSRVETHNSSTSGGSYGKVGGHAVRVNVGRPDHLKEQLYARKVYALFSRNPPKVDIQEVGENQALVTPVPPDSKPMAQSGDSARESLKKGFILDAFLSNVEVVGKDMTNVLVDGKGTVYRMDVSSCLRYNPDGSHKDWFSGEVTEATTFLDPQKSPSTAKAFQGLAPFDETVKNQIKALLTKQDEILQIFPDDLRELMGQRLSFLKSHAS